MYFPISIVANKQTQTSPTAKISLWKICMFPSLPYFLAAGLQVVSDSSVIIMPARQHLGHFEFVFEKDKKEHHSEMQTESILYEVSLLLTWKISC